MAEGDSQARYADFDDGDNDFSAASQLGGAPVQRENGAITAIDPKAVLSAALQDAKQQIDHSTHLLQQQAVDLRLLLSQLPHTWDASPLRDALATIQTLLSTALPESLLALSSGFAKRKRVPSVPSTNAKRHKGPIQAAAATVRFAESATEAPSEATTDDVSSAPLSTVAPGPKKRGRPPKAKAQVTQAVIVPADPKKRGRPSKPKPVSSSELAVDPSIVATSDLVIPNQRPEENAMTAATSEEVTNSPSVSVEAPLSLTPTIVPDSDAPSSISTEPKKRGRPKKAAALPIANLVSAEARTTLEVPGTQDAMPVAEGKVPKQRGRPKSSPTVEQPAASVRPGADHLQASSDERVSSEPEQIATPKGTLSTQTDATVIQLAAPQPALELPLRVMSPQPAVAASIVEVAGTPESDSMVSEPDDRQSKTDTGPDPSRASTPLPVAPRIMDISPVSSAADEEEQASQEPADANVSLPGPFMDDSEDDFVPAHLQASKENPALPPIQPHIQQEQVKAPVGVPFEKPLTAEEKLAAKKERARARRKSYLDSIKKARTNTMTPSSSASHGHGPFSPTPLPPFPSQLGDHMFMSSSQASQPM
ncbi:hypothetical protein BCR37DRAFT_386544 [Protomyces lactucae-debilis]|uniref:Uncharacterized protein n=1 Tax=Protomyces lactucae-debilis TaxID=2754530 RepID=A0A1Y2FLZ2_PROLT|nr:uncharacterized protein BCR37DRAFT_386544 [Protomyces lactucae-debilis]ORY84374.1 hypothetical protein BCR37DRAFT_386544 [Protomyces lactucae-debilis]